MVWLPCDYFDAEVELTDERLRHVRRKHSDIGSEPYQWIEETLASPDRVHQRSWARDEFLLTRRMAGREDRWIVVVVVEDEPKDDTSPVRRWVVTAYLAGEDEVSGEVIWEAE